MFHSTRQLCKALFLLATFIIIGYLFVTLFTREQIAVDAQVLQSRLQADYYVCDCSTNADPDCVPGDDANGGDTMESPWRTYEKARSEFGNLPAGDAIRFCRGGAFDLASGYAWVNENCTSAVPCTVSDYAPPWASGDEARPILQRLSIGHGFSLANGGNAEHQEGVIIENLDLRCLVCGSGQGNGIFLYNDIDDVIINNVRVEAFDIGIHLAGANSCSPDDPDCNGINERLSVRNSTVLSNTVQGFLGGGDGLIIENSYFQNNGGGTIFDHNIYVSNASNVRIAGNELYRSSLDDQGRCTGVSLVAHGVMDNLVIENNLVREDIGFSTPYCWGIAVDPGYDTPERFENLVIRGNKVINVGNIAIGTGACVNCLVENNVVIHEQDYWITAIAVPNRSSGTGDAETTGAIVRNNSILIGSEGMGIRVSQEGSGYSILSNAIRYTGDNSNWNCLQADLPAASYDIIDYNVCGFGVGEWADNIGDLATWQALGWDTHSQAVNPGFADLPNGDLSAASASAPMVDSGHPSLSSLVDIDGNARDARPDAGAYEFIPALSLYGTPGDQVIYLTWSVDVTPPVTSTWQIDYRSQTGTAYLPITGIVSPTRAYTLTGLTNYVWYTVTLNAMLDTTPFLTDTVRVMPTDIFVYLPLVLRSE